MKVSFLVLTYNSLYEKLIKTIKSILEQKDIDFEILICDDGSNVNYSNELSNFFKEINFINYTLIMNTNNQGTVKNILSGIQQAKGDIIKLLSPGDYLFSDTTTSNFLIFFKKHNPDILFGKCIHYNQYGIYKNKNRPKLLTPYKKNDYKKIKHNYLFTRDLIIGASVFYKKEILEEYLKKISPTIKYSEDSLINYYLCEKNKLNFLDIPVIYYEIGDGISTSNSSKWTRILSTEVNLLFEELYEKKLISKFIYINQKNSNKFYRLFFLLLCDTSNFLKLFFQKMFSKSIILPLETDEHLIQILKESSN